MGAVRPKRVMTDPMDASRQFCGKMVPGVAVLFLLTQESSINR